MNRRTFLIGVGAAACGTPAVRTPRRSVDPEPGPAVPGGQDIPMFRWYDSQTHRSPIAFRSDLLVLSTGTQVWSWDANTMARVDGYELPHEHCCFVQDGTLAVFARVKESSTCLLVRIDANGIRERLPGGVFGASGDYPTHLLPASSADEVYVTKDKDVYLMRAVQGRLEQVTTIPIPDAYRSNRGQMFSLGDGRLIAPGADLHMLQARQPAVTYSLRGRHLLHMVPATDERLWYSFPSTGYQAADVLVLAKLVTPAVDEQRLQFAPARIVHLASSGRAVAALLFSFREGASPTEPIREWTVVVVDEGGTERWRAPVPEAFTPGLVTLNQVGFLAMSEHRVVLFGERPPIAWDAATGAPVG